MKSSLEQSNESVHAKQKKNVSMLNNALLVQKWISSFDIKNINEIFNENHVIPPEIQKFEKENYQPNQKNNNDKILNTTSSMEFSRNNKGLEPKRERSFKLSRNQGVTQSVDRKNHLVRNSSRNVGTQLEMAQNHDSHLIMIDEKKDFVQNLVNSMSQNRLINNQSLANLTHSTSDPKIDMKNMIVSPKVIKPKNIIFGPKTNQKDQLFDKLRELQVKT